MTTIPVKGQDKRPPDALDSARRQCQLNQNGRHVGLDFYDLLIEGGDTTEYIRTRLTVVQFLTMPFFNYFCAIVVFLIGVVALYQGVTGKDISPTRSMWGNPIPLSKLLYRTVCFIVAGIAIYILVSIVASLSVATQ